YALKYEKYPPHGGPAGLGRLTSQSLDEAVLLISAAMACDLIGDAPGVSREDYGIIVKKLLIPAAKHVEGYNFGVHNIQIWHAVSALSAAALAGNDGMAQRSIKSLSDQIDKGITPDGFWYEMSSGYHLYAMKPLSVLAAICKNKGVDLCSRPSFIKFFKVLPKMTLPDFSLPPINDYRHNVNLSEMTAGAALAKYALNDPYFDGLTDALIARSGDLNSFERNFFIYHRSEADKKGGGDLWKPPEESVHFPASGVTVLRKAGKYALVKYHGFSGGHDHFDRPEIFYFDGRKELFPDLGTVPYGHPLYQSWYRTTEAHNTMMVDGLQENRAACTPTAFVNDRDYTGLTVDCTSLYEGVDIRRTVILMESGLVDIVSAKSEGSHTYDLFLHVNSPNDAALEFKGGEPIKGVSPNKEIAFYSKSEPGRGKSISFQSAGESSPSAVSNFMTSGRADLYEGLSTGFHPDEKIPVVLLRAVGKTALFVTSTTSNNVNQNGDVKKDGYNVLIDLGNGRKLNIDSSVGLINK
ncbi:MAG TPA: heparinase II/III family protein, partial [bacterium]|nr:heparinase II/III family protein [bacterium]